MAELGRLREDAIENERKAIRLGDLGKAMFYESKVEVVDDLLRVIRACENEGRDHGEERKRRRES